MPMRKYIPNDRDREIILRMAAIPGVSRDDIAFLIVNERTKKPISRMTLEKHYRKELDTAMTVMRDIAMTSFVEQIKAHSWPATRMAMSNYCGLKDGEVVANVDATNNITVSFRGVDPETLRDNPPPPNQHWLAPRQLPPPILEHEPDPPRPRYGDIPEAPAPRETEHVQIKRGGQQPGPANSMLIPSPQGPRTELDIPGNEDALPWHKRKLTGQIRSGPLVWGGKSNKNGWLK